MSREKIFDDLQNKLKTLDETLWENRAKWPHVQKWLSQFARDDVDEQIQALFLVSHFMYFGLTQIRALLRSLYRDVFRYKVVEQIRRQNLDTRDRQFIEREFQRIVARTRFIGVGNPSESGSHLLYYFRQENRLGKEYFINSHEIFSRVGTTIPIQNEIRNKAIRRYVFIDDLCGSGSQASAYADDLIRPLKQLDPDVRVSYYTLFATTCGLEHVRRLGYFDDVDTLVELDESFKCFSENSRIYSRERLPFSRTEAEEICRRYGLRLMPAHPLGWREGQLLVGFYYNTPDNTLPIIWYNEPDGQPWTPLFRRYPKQYGWEA